MSPKAPKTGREILAESMSEADLQREVAKRADHYGLLHYHTHRSDRSDPGWPDSVFVGRGMIVRELKRQKGSRTSEDQKAWMAALEAAGVDVALWRPIDLHNGRIDAEMAAIAPPPGARLVLPSQHARRAAPRKAPRRARVGA